MAVNVDWEQVRAAVKSRFHDKLPPWLYTEFAADIKRRKITIHWKRIIGEGGYGKVYAATHIEDDTPSGQPIEEDIVVKVISDGQNQFQDEEDIILETLLSANLSHCHVVTTFLVYAAIVDNRPDKQITSRMLQGYDTFGTVLVQELLQGGTLHHYLREIHADQEQPLPEALVRCWTWQTLLGLNFLTNAYVSHHDLHKKNLMIDSHGTVKIIDFGLAKQHEGHATHGGQDQSVAALPFSDLSSGFTLTYGEDMQAVGYLVCHLLNLDLDQEVKKTDEGNDQILGFLRTCARAAEVRRQGGPEAWPLAQALNHSWLVSDPLSAYFTFC